MSAVDQLLQAGDNSVGRYTFLDADTIRDPDNPDVTYRLQGFDAPEISKLKQDGTLSAGTAGGAASVSAITKLASEQGFDNLVKTGQKDQFGRDVVELRDANGRNFTTEIIRSGVLDPGKFTKQEDIDAAQVNALFGRSALHGDPAWAEAAAQVQGGINNELWRQQEFKQQAVNEAMLAAAPGRYTSAVQFRHPDRTLLNESNNPFSDSWEQGWIGVKESAYGITNLLGETTGNEWLADVGEAGVTRARTQIQEYGTTLTDWKEVDDIGSAFQYVTNNAALSLPYMAITIGATAAAPVTGGLSLTAPAAVYAGQTWNEQEGDNKNAAIAIGSGITQAALDRIGLGFIFKTGVAPTKLLNNAVNELVKKGATEEAAKATVFAATRKEIAGFVGDAAKVAQQQITAKNVSLETLKRLGIGASGEAVTEGLQEAVGYLGAHNQGVFGDQAFDWDAFTDRVVAGAIAGGTLGGTFSVPGAAYDAGAWADVAYRQAPADARLLSQAGRHAKEEEAQHGRIASVNELAANAKARATSNLKDFRDRAADHKKAKTQQDLQTKIFGAVSNIPGLWRGLTRHVFKPHLTDQSRSLRILRDMFGGGLQKTFSGATFENAKHHAVTIYKNYLGSPEQTFANFNNGKITTRTQRGEISDRIYAKLRGAIDPDTKKFNPDLIPDTDPEKAQLVALQQQLHSLSEKMYADQKQFNPDLGHLENYLLRYKSFDKRAIVDDKHGFVQALKDEFGFTDAEALQIAENITNSAEINDISEALESYDSAKYPGSHKSRTLNLSEKDAFQKYFQKDIFANAAAAAKSAARYKVQQEYVGGNNEVINQLLTDAQNEGVSEADINEIAAGLDTYFAAESGNYKRPKSETGKTIQKIQRNFMMVTTLAGLPLATISSFVEAALTVRGLTMGQIFGDGKKPGGLYRLGNELGHTLWSGMGEIAAVADKKQRYPAATAGKEAIENLGYYDWDVGAATVSGTTEINPHQQYIYEAFFKATGLTGWTNYTRAVRGAIAGDYIIDKLNTITGTNGNLDTNEVQEAREQLRNLGINVQDMVDAYRGNGMFDPNSAATIETNLREGMFNFVNDAVALPQSANRPLIYQDPRFALFTQFQGFIATFTANHLPKLWGEYVKRGTPAMKYNAFAVMTTMIMMGFASQYLKDLIKYGELRQFGPDEHPFLNTSEYVQRGIRASGLLGTGERVLDQFFPLYDQRTEGITDWAFQGLTDESPALGYAKRAGQAVGSALTGDVGGAAKQGSRFIPGAGVLNFVRDKIGESASAWNFNGE